MRVDGLKLARIRRLFTTEEAESTEISITDNRSAWDKWIPFSWGISSVVQKRFSGVRRNPLTRSLSTIIFLDGSLASAGV